MKLKIESFSFILFSLNCVTYLILRNFYLLYFSFPEIFYLSGFGFSLFLTTEIYRLDINLISFFRVLSEIQDSRWRTTVESKLEIRILKEQRKARKNPSSSFSTFVNSSEDFGNS